MASERNLTMRRYLWFVFLVIFVLLSSGLALAQDEMQDVYCGTLSEQDCDLLIRNKDFALTAASVDLNMEMTATVDDEAETFIVAATGAFVADPDMMASLKDMQPPMTTLDQIKMLVEIMRGLDGELTITITPPATMAELPPGIDAITLEVKLVDGVGYINMETLAPLMGSAGEDNGMQGWAGLDIVGLFDAVIEEHPEQFEFLGNSTQSIDPAMIAQFQNVERIKQYVDIQRTSAEDAPVAVFETTVDLAAMVDDPAFTELVLQAMEAQLESQPDLSEAERQQATEISLGIVKGMTVVVTQSIDRETAAPVNFDISIAMDTSQLPASADINLTSMNVNIALAFADVNDVASIAAPEDANILPVESLLAMWGSGED